jgi:hypothetical protein
LVRPLREGENINVLGFTPKALKQLKGERLEFPRLSIVLAKAMGRGATALNSTRCKICEGIVFGSMVDIGCLVKVNGNGVNGKWKSNNGE